MYISRTVEKLVIFDFFIIFAKKHQLMKVILSCLLLLVTTANLRAQKANVTWSDDTKMKKGTLDLDIIYADKSGIYAQETRLKMKSYFVIGATYGEGIKLKKFDRNFEEVFDKEYKKELKGRSFNSFFVLKGKVYMYAEDYDKKEKRFQVFVTEIDGASGDLVNDWTEVLSLDRESKKDEFSFHVIHSADSSRMVVVADMSTKENSSVTLVAVDNRLRVSKPITIQFTDPPGSYDMQEVLITPDNKTVIAGKQYEYIETGKRKKRKMRVFKKYLLSIYNDNGKKTADINADVDDKFTLNGKLIFSKKGNLLLTGFYTKDAKKATTDGLYLYRINTADGAILQKSIKELNTGMIGKTQEDTDDEADDDTKQEKKAKKKADDDDDVESFNSNYVFREVIEGIDGSLVIVAETYKLDIYTSTYFDNSRSSGGLLGSTRTVTTTTYSHTCGEILISRMLPDGNIAWLNVVPKYQVESVSDRSSSNSGMSMRIGNSPVAMLGLSGGMPFMSSFKAIPVGNKLMLFFNDNPKNQGANKAEDDIRKTYNFKKSDCFAVTVDMTNGTYTRKSIFSNNDEPVPYIRHGQTVNNELYIAALRTKVIGKNMFKIGKITVK
jgi:hypothetical protein